MEYGYNFDEDSPRFALTSLWFLLGVIVFGFTVLIMTAIVTGGPDRGYYLNVQPQPERRTRRLTRKTSPRRRPRGTSS